MLSSVAGPPSLEMAAQTPAYFIENLGQWEDAATKFVLQGSGARVAMTDTGPVFELISRALPPVVAGPLMTQEPESAVTPQGSENSSLSRAVRFRASFTGAREVEPIGLHQAETTYGFFRGDASRWRDNVRAFSVLAYEDLYPGVDLLTWGQADGIKYEFHIAPVGEYGVGAESQPWRQIRISYDGIEGLSIDDAGALHVRLPEGIGEVIDAAPYIFQDTSVGRVEVAGRFDLLDDKTYGFEITGEYDPSLPLVIDPELSWAGFLGGQRRDIARAVAVDQNGNVIVVGVTDSLEFPVAGGVGSSPHLDQFDTVEDAFVTKIKADGSAIIWSGYIGGTWGDEALGVAVDAVGNIAVSGITMSVDFPRTQGFGSAWHGETDLSKLESEAFVMKFTPVGQLAWSGLLGGSHADAANAVAFDSHGDVVVVGGTWSSDFSVAGTLHSGFLTTSYRGAPIPTPPDTNTQDVGDAFVAKISADGSTLKWSGYLGGSARDTAKAIAVDAQGAVFVTGYTRSSDFPTRASFDTTFNGAGTFNPDAEGGDAFVVKIRPDGNEVIWSAFLGGSGIESGYGIAVDAGGDVIVGGYTSSGNFPTVGNADATLGGDFDGFVTRIRGDGSSIVWSRFIGGTDAERLRSISLDGAGNIYAGGNTASDDFPLLNHFQVRPQREFAQYYDAFVTKLAPSGQTIWSSYLGGTADDACYGVAAHGATVYVVGETWAGTFPARNSFDNAFSGPGPSEWGAFYAGDGYIARITDRADWTLMVYSTSDSDLESWGMTYLAQLEGENFLGLPDGRQVRIMMLMDRSANDTGTDYSGDSVPSSGANWSDTRRAEIVHNAQYSPFDNKYVSSFVTANPQKPELNMGDPQTLVDFVQWSMSYAPAHQYALIFWGHGYGWQGTQYDDNNGATPPAIDSLSMPELRSALDSISKLDLVVMDSCLMQQAEVATEFWGHTDFLVGSEQVRNAGDINYPKWLPTLRQVPNISAQSLAQVIVNADENAYVSALDMSKLGTLNAAIESFALAATTLAGPSDLQRLQTAIGSATWFHTNTYRDLKEYMQAVAADTAINATVRGQASAVVSALGQVVMPGHKGGGGLAIYLPDNAVSLDGSYGAALLRFCDIDAGPPGTRWADFFRKMLGAPAAVVPTSDVGNNANSALALTVAADGVPVTIESEIGSGNDADFYKFTGLSGDAIHVEVTGARVDGVTPVLTLYGPDKTTILVRVNADANGRAVLDRYSITQSGDYYVSITPQPPQLPVQSQPVSLASTALDDSGRYTLSIRRGAAAQMRPQLVVPATLAFGDVALGDTKTATLTLTNSGGTPLTITSLTTSSGGVFDPSQAPLALPLRIAPGASVTLTASVSPGSAGAAADTLQIHSDDPSQPIRNIAMTAAVVDPITIYDQYLLELINRGRANPSAEASRFGITLNEGLGAGTISATAKQPLALNPTLTIAARDHSQWMLDTDTFSHTGANGSTWTQRMTAAGYDFVAPWGSGENIALRYSSGTINLTQATAAMHQDLFVDEDYPGRGHRVNLMSDDFKEVGLGVLPGLWGTNNAAIVTEDFAYRAGNSFLTGVAFNDSLIDDDFYTPGEGLGGVTVQATRTGDNAVFSTMTWSAGGYSLPLPPGTYTVVASGGGLPQPVTYTGVSIGTQNVKRDFIIQQAQTPPEITVLLGQTNIVDGQSTPINLGSTTQGAAPLTATFTVRNDGGQALALGSVNLPAGFTLTEGLVSSLAPGASDAFTIQLSTTTVGVFSGQLSFTNNDSDENPFNFTVSGTVSAVTAGPEITVLMGSVGIVSGQTTPIDFGSVALGGAGPTRTFTIRNDGDQNLSFTSLTYPDGYTVVKNFTSPIAPGASDTLILRLDTAEAGVISGHITIVNNDADEGTFRFPVTGTVTTTSVGDAYEADNDPFTARPISTDGTPQARSINPLGDRDFVTFTLTQTRNVTIATNGAAGDTRIWLYGPDNPYLLIEGDDDDGPGLFSLIERTGANALPAGTYWVEVQEYDDTRIIDSYTLAVTASAPQTLFTTTLQPGSKYAFTDANGTAVTLSFTGKSGSAVVARSVPAGQSGDIVFVELQGTDAKSGLTITGKGGTDNGVTTVGKIMGNSPMGKLTGKLLDLVGDGVVMSGQGTFTSITLRDLKNGADLILPGASVTSGVAINLGLVEAGVLIDSESPIKSFAASAWTGEGWVAAPWLGTLTTKANTARGLTGNFAASLAITGEYAPAGKALGSAKIAGAITGGEWTLVGHTGVISAAEVRPAFSIEAAGMIGGVSSKGHISGQYEAMALASLSTPRDLYNATLRLHQPVVSGNPKITALGKLAVGGWMDNVTLRTDGSIGIIAVGGFYNSTILAGVSSSVSNLPTGSASFVAPATITSIKMKGMKDPFDPHSFINTNIAAWNLGSISLVGAKRANGQTHGLAAHTIKSLNLTQPDKSKYTWPDKWLASPGDFVVRLL